MQSSDFIREKTSTATVEINGHLFYPSARALTKEELKTVQSAFANKTSTRAFSGEKKCGGFHPDYCLRFATESAELSVLVYFGCEEILFASKSGVVRLDADNKLIAQLKQLLTKVPD